MLKQSVHTIEKGHLHYVLDGRGKPRRHQAWLADQLAFLYDWIMEHNVLPKKLGGDFEAHLAALRQRLVEVHGKRVLDIGAGTGSIAACLASDNEYWGTDISPGLLRRGRRRLVQARFGRCEFYVAPADDLPFADDTFDLALCNLTANFLADLDGALREWHRLLRPEGYVLCSVPVPERNTRGSTINGALRSEAELGDAAGRNGFSMETLPVNNGAILYFVLRRLDAAPA